MYSCGAAAETLTRILDNIFLESSSGVNEGPDGVAIAAAVVVWPKGP